METYFVVLQLPGNEELKFNYETPNHFLKSAYYFLTAGAAQIVSIRKDTGVSEDVRNHISTCSSYKSYLLLYIPLTISELTDHTIIMQKACDIIKEANYEALVDFDERFQLVLAECLDTHDRKGKYKYDNLA